jgi:hypothetical protein
MLKKTQFPKINLSLFLISWAWKVSWYVSLRFSSDFMQGPKMFRIVAGLHASYRDTIVTTVSKRSFCTNGIIGVPCFSLLWSVVWQRMIMYDAADNEKKWTNPKCGLARLWSARLSLAPLPSPDPHALPRWSDQISALSDWSSRGSLIALMMEIISTSETSINSYQTTRRENLEDSHLHTRHRENLKSHLAEIYPPWIM